MFETLVFILVVMLLLLAALDLFVGVSNDAANFLSSAVGTRIAPLFVVMIVASAGVLLGATFSSGMMEIARKGMLHPDLFTFKEIILVFAAVVISDVLLLNLFNSFGLPTSTTVSIVFELLGAATFCSFYKVSQADMSLAEIFNYIKLDRTATIVSAILLSVVLAFITGMVTQFISRVLFTFRFNRSVKYLGGLYAGLSLSAIAYFLIMKGAKGASFMKPEYIAYMDAHVSEIMWSVFAGFAIIGQLMVFAKLNVFKMIILSGTFALAFSFAGNDLVNFVGVPLAALDSFNHWSESGLDASVYTMDSLNSSSVTSTIWLFAAGFIMCVTLWFSKKARQVVQTSINLSNSTTGSKEQFGASTLGRIITRMGLIVSKSVYRVIPEISRGFIRSRYRKPPVVKGQEPLPFDYVRASINLVVSAALISIATSYKLPLSTTYVCFMVAMGSSFADGAWDRESAVYRISGVITVIAGWFLTGICAFTFSCFVNFILCYTGYGAVFVAMPLVFMVIIYTNFIRKPKSQTSSLIQKATSDKEILDVVSSSVPGYFERDLKCIRNAVDAFFDDNEFALRKYRNKASNIHDEIADARSAYYSLANTSSRAYMNKNMKSVTGSTSDAKFFFYLVYSNMLEAAKSVHYTLDSAVNHIANRHSVFAVRYMKDSIYELLKRLEQIGDDVQSIGVVNDLHNVEFMIKHSKKLNRDIDKCQIELVSIIGREHVSMHSSEMYLNFLQCMRDMANRYVSVLTQERALAQIVSGDANAADLASSQLQSPVLGQAFRSDREDLALAEDESVYTLPPSPAAIEAMKAAQK